MAKLYLGTREITPSIYNSGGGVSIESVIGQYPLSVSIEASDDGTGMGQMTFSGEIYDFNDIMYKITGKHFSTNYTISPDFTDKWVSDDNELELTVMGSLDLTTVVDEFSTTHLMYPVAYVMYGLFENWSTGEKEPMIYIYNNGLYDSGIVIGTSEIMVQ